MPGGRLTQQERQQIALGLADGLVAAGDRGMSFGAACAAMDAAGKLDSPDRKLALATGHPGDVYLCHPFLIHAAQPHRGQEPRFMA